MAWTQDRVETLRKLWAEGLSASQIARQIGGVTRNAVIGKVHRLGLSGRSKKPLISTAAIGGAQDSARAQNQKSILAEYYETPRAQSEKTSLMHLTKEKCRWPIGDPAAKDFHFCGGKALEDSPYCQEHAKTASQVIDKKRKKVASQ